MDLINWDWYKRDALNLLRKRRIVPLTARICDELEAVLMECLREAMTTGMEEITIWLDSNGGDYPSAVAIANALKESGLKTKGVVLSRARSGAMVVLQACDVRSACVGASLLMHFGRSGLSNAEQFSMLTGEGGWVVDQVNDENREMIELMIARSKISFGEAVQMCSLEQRISAHRAKKLGLVDNVLWNIVRVPRSLRPRKTR